MLSWLSRPFWAVADTAPELAEQVPMLSTSWSLNSPVSSRLMCLAMAGRAGRSPGQGHPFRAGPKTVLNVDRLCHL